MLQTHGKRRRGSVLILVVAMLAVLFVTGMGFLSMSSMDRRSSGATRGQSGINIEADAAVQMVVAELSRDLWGADNKFLSGVGANEGWDYPCSGDKAAGGTLGVNDDAWLASTLPEVADASIPNNSTDPAIYQNRFKWPHISNFSGLPADDTNVIASSLDADADRDGVNDSRFILSPSGRYRVAIRVVDLNSMINLNTAGRATINDLGMTQYNVGAAAASQIGAWDLSWGQLGTGQIGLFSDGTLGRGQSDYASVLDNPYIRLGGAGIPVPFADALPFRTMDTLALLSYGIKPGPVAARFVPCWPSTFSTSRKNMPNITSNTVDPADSLNMYFTTYGWTRQLRRGLPTVALPAQLQVAGVATTWQDWQNILNAYEPTGLSPAPINGVSYWDAASGTVRNHGVTDPHDPVYTRGLVAAIVLSGAMIDEGDGRTPLTPRQVEQLIVNLVDFRDTDQNVSQAGVNVDTVFHPIGTSADIFGVEPQVFIVELGAALGVQSVGNRARSNNAYALELYNPYAAPVVIEGWQVVTPGGTVTITNNNPLTPGVPATVQPGGRYVIISNEMAPPTEGGEPLWQWMAGWNCKDSKLKFGVKQPFGMTYTGPAIPQAGNIHLTRPGAGGAMVVVDSATFDCDTAYGCRMTGSAHAGTLASPGPWLAPAMAGQQYIRRGDREWMQARDVYGPSDANTFGAANGLMGSSGDSNYASDAWYMARRAAGEETPIIASALPPTTAAWANNAYYLTGQILWDAGTSSWWRCCVPHASAKTGTFAADRTARPTCWRPYVAHSFDTLGQLQWLMLDGPRTLASVTATPPTDYSRKNADGTWFTDNISLVSKISRLTGIGATGTQSLYLNSSLANRGDVKVFGNLVCLDRAHDGTDSNGDGTIDDADEVRQAGLININTATPFVLRYLNWLLYTGDTADGLDGLKSGAGFSTVNQDIYSYAKNQSPRGFRKGVSELGNVSTLYGTTGLFSALRYSGASYANTLRNKKAELRFFYSSPPPTGFDVNGNVVAVVPGGAPKCDPWVPDQAAGGDFAERHFVFDRISDLVTTRSDTFLAYILVQEINTDYQATDARYVVQSRRLVTIIDRSRCNKPPADANYRAPEVVGRSVATW
ncbi:MAG: hypothetical protein PHU85_13490 [Phycisphaerae bacterium]|nr:hypothetical protein [Phycisphaerae bacterium]